MRFRNLFVLVSSLALTSTPFFAQQQTRYPFNDPTLPVDKRIDNLLSLMTTDEKVAVLGTQTAVPRLGVPNIGSLLHRGSRSGLTWPAAPPAPWSKCIREKTRNGKTPDRSRRPQRDGRSCGVRRFDESAAAHASHGHSAGLRRPTVEDWKRSIAQVPRLVDALPNGPVGHPTVRRLPRRRRAGSDAALAAIWACSIERLPHRQRRTARPRPRLVGEIASGARGCAKFAGRADGIDPDRRHHEPGTRRQRPDLDGDVPARQPRSGRCGHQEHRHRSERGGCRRSLSQDRPGAGVPSEKARHRRNQEPRTGRIQPGDIIVLICRGPMGAGMEEIYQITSALKHLSFGKQVAVLTDARFSGVSTGACIGHVGPEALAGGPIGKVPRRRPHSNRHRPQSAGRQRGSGRDDGNDFGAEEGTRVLAGRAPRPDLAAEPICRTIRDCGRRCRPSAAAPGAAAFTMWMRLCGAGEWMEINGKEDSPMNATKIEATVQADGELHLTNLPCRKGTAWRRLS